MKRYLFITSIIIHLIIIFGFSVTILFKVWLNSRNLLRPMNVHILDLHKEKFNNYLIQFGKRYSGNEYDLRLRNFKVLVSDVGKTSLLLTYRSPKFYKFKTCPDQRILASLTEIAKLNAIEDDAEFGLTQFSDMSAQEFAEQMLMKRVGKHCRRITVDCYASFVNNTSKLSEQYSEEVPEKFDWREHEGVVGPVLNQKKCLGCWAFGIVGVMESMATIQKIKHEPLSIQELLDCSSYNTGCLGGNVASALDFLCSMKLSIVSEEEYPLTLWQSCDCKVPMDSPGIRVRNYKYQCRMNEEDILREIAFHGPVVTIVNAAPWAYYLGGVIRRACVRNERSYEHVVQIVGYDKSAEVPYYIVRNSWGSLFGENGYVKVAIYSNVCGIAEEVSMLDVVPYNLDRWNRA